jgi:flavin-dependent dehydrogenase
MQRANSMNSIYDCIVIGGGPAGNTVATLVAQAGKKTLLLERDAHPRFHIGESLMPETYWTFERLGLLPKMQESPFTKKFSVQFVNHAGKESAPFYFHDRDPRSCSQTWQVLRSQFDEMMWRHAGESGAELRQRARVLDVLFDGDRAVGVQLQTADQPPEEVRGRVIVDATGQQGLLANKLGIRESIPELRKAAIWNYYRGARREEGLDEGATLVLQTNQKDSWFWYIPLHDDVVSVGVVGDVDYLLRERGSIDEIFAQEVAKCSAVEERIQAATATGEFRVLREFSYRSRQPAGNGWVLVGDALTFLDPIYSSGVFLALKSGELAADAIVQGLAKNDMSAQQLGGWTTDFNLGTKWIAKLIAAFYNKDFSFGKFIMQHPSHKDHITDLLVGKVFSDEAGVFFRDLEAWLAAPKA